MSSNLSEMTEEQRANLTKELELLDKVTQDPLVGSAAESIVHAYRTYFLLRDYLLRKFKEKGVEDPEQLFDGLMITLYEPLHEKFTVSSVKRNLKKCVIPLIDEIKRTDKSNYKQGDQKDGSTTSEEDTGSTDS